MKIIKNPGNDDLLEAIQVLSSGGIVLYPTDTVYGLAANIFDKKAVKRVYEIKNRSLLKPLSILVSSVDVISKVAILGRGNIEILDKYLPGPYTFILNKTTIVPFVVTAGLKKVGVRVPNNNIARKLASIFPITTTSANLSGHKTLNSPLDIINQLDCDIDLILDVGSLDSTSPSTIIDLTTDKINFLKR